ncbi:beta strand repeat-containing protein [Algibacter miyuki]|uniref:Beta strand repeat-containing protein n=1 Tax=Algibacter miyuki TaxID=1306933 RepID=A0ABV5H0A4_9FLAO|nr:DUF1566 domain-containing protein [Algibacter miyuki]MDN3667602.1 DUF1566 domain-containing protein [Algibacter miyuki]
MKKLILLFLLIAANLQGFSQTPGISYQAVILNPDIKELPGANAQTSILANSELMVRFTVIDDLNNHEYQEYHQTTTDAYGMINLLIGHGTATTSNNFEDIQWTGFAKQLKVEIDFSGIGNNFTSLSEQALTFMPQPAIGQDAKAILGNTAGITGELARAKTAEAAIQLDVDTNETASNTADATLQSNIDTVQADVNANKTATNTAIAAVQSDVNANETARNSADATLQSNIDSVQADVNANKTATNTAIAAVQSDVNANETASNTADATLQSNIDSVQADVNANETATNNKLDLKVDKVTGKGLSTEDYSTTEKTKLAAITGSNTGDQDLSSYATTTNLDLKANSASPTFTGTVSGITSSMVGLANVDNTSDANKPVSTATQTALDSKVDKVTGKGLSTEDYSTTEKTKLAAITGSNTGDQDLSGYATNTNLDLKANSASPTFTGRVSGITSSMVGLANVDNTSDANKPVSTATQTALDSKVDKVTGKGLSTEDYSTTEKTKLAAITGSNTGDQDLSSYATNTNLDLKANSASPTFTGTVSGITSSMVGLANVDNTSDANKPVSTATQTALDSKVDKVTGKGLSTEDYSTIEKTKLAAITGSNTGDQDLSSYATNTNLDLKANSASPTFTGTVSGITSSMVGLANVDNTSDANKPVSTAGQTALDLKVDKVTGKGLSTEDYSTTEKTKLAAITGSNTGDQDLSSYATTTNLDLKANSASPTFTGTVSGITSSMVGLANVDNTSDANKPISTATQTALDLKVDKVTGKGLSTEDYSTSEKTKLAAITGSNTGDQDLSGYATTTNLDLKANSASPTFTGTVSGITSNMVGLANVDNTSDANKPVSTATQTALDSKVDKVTGKGLSTEDYSTTEKTKLAAITGSNTGDQDLSSYATTTNLDLKADIASPTFTGTPLAPTATAGTNTTQIATTAFVTSQVANYLPLSGGELTGALSGTTGTFSSSLVSGGLNLRNTTKEWALGFNGDGLALHQGGCCNRLTIDTDGNFGIGANYTPSYKLDVEGDARFTSTVTGNSFVKSGGTSSQFLKGDGSVDATAYAPLASPTFTGTVSGITSNMVGLGNVDNTSDANKPVSTATQTALDLKVDKVTGKGLSTEDYSTIEKTKLAAITGSNTGDQDLSGYATNTNLDLKADIASPTFTGTVSGITSAMVGLANVDNTSDANKPVSTAGQTALDLKVDKVTGKGLSTEDYSTTEKTKLAAITGSNTGDQDLSGYATTTNLDLKANSASPTFTGTVSGITSNMVGLANVDNTSDANKPVSTATQTALDSKVDKVAGKGLSTEDYSTIEKTKLAAITGSNTGDQDLSSYATNSNLDLKADIASPTFTGTVSGITSAMVGLANVDNTSDANKPVSTAGQTALDLKANLDSPTFTGTPLAPTAVAGTSTTQLATTAFVSEAFDTVISNGVAAQTLAIGDFVGGGVVFWVDPVDNSKGLVCSIDDQSNGIQWYNGSYLTTGATGTAVETGASNTDAIIAVQGATETNYAAGLARAYNGGGFTDWYLPSKDELYQISINRAAINGIIITNGGVDFGGGSSSYWSSTETGSSAWALFFGNRHQQSFNKNSIRRVRAVRAVGFPAISSLTTITAEQAAQNTAIDLKVDKVTGKGLSTEDYSTSEKTKLAAITGSNTGDQDLSSYATNSNLDLKANIASPTFTGTVTIPSLIAGTYTFPSTDGTTGQVLATNGSGLLAWSTPAAGATNINELTDALVSSTSLFLGNIPSNINNSDATYNVAVGKVALNAITIGDFNVAMGEGALETLTTGSNNVALGYNTLVRNEAGNHNTAVGWNALEKNTVNYNTAYGYSALRKTNTGTQNTATGPYALFYNTTGGYNTANGMESLYANSTGNYNTAYGYNSLGQNTTGSYNVAMGESAGKYTQNGTNSNQVGSYNVFIGANSKSLTSSNQNQIVIGYDAIGGGSNTIQLGNTSITDVNTSGAITALSYIKSGGTSSQYLMADGSVSTGAAAVREVADEFTATASQTSFTLTQAPSPNSKVKMYINGIRISNTAYSTSGVTLTYLPANNGGYALASGDRIQFDFYY